VIQAPEFARRDQNERASSSRRWGEPERTCWFPDSRRCSPGGIFRGSNEEERQNAALALAWLGTPAAVAVLNRELGSNRDNVRRAVELALEAVRSAAMGSGKGGADDESAAAAPGGES